MKDKFFFCTKVKLQKGKWKEKKIKNEGTVITLMMIIFFGLELHLVSVLDNMV